MAHFSASADSLIPNERKFPGQFKITLKPAPAPDGFRAFKVGRVYLTVEQSLDTIPLIDSIGRTVGLVLGRLVDYRHSRIIHDQVTLSPRSEAGSGADDLDQSIEKTLYQFGGSYLCVVSTRNVNRVYLDAGGTKSLVFEPSRKEAASTTGLLLDNTEYVSRFREELFNALDVNGYGWFPSFLTAHDGVQRVLCNHYLDLNDWSLKRHWPNAHIVAQDTDETIHRMGEIVKRTLETLTGEGPVACALTAGNETRFQLAASRRLLDKLNFITVAYPAAKKDGAVAKELARRFNLNHSVYPFVRATSEQAKLWQYRASHCIGGANKHGHPSTTRLADYSFFCGGTGGEICRGFFWRPSDHPAMAVSADNLVSRFGMPRRPETLEATELWARQTPTEDPHLWFDLAYLEHRVSAWAFTQTYTNVVEGEHIHPLISRETICLMLSLPPEIKRSNEVFRHGINLLWPELLNVPINKYGDYRDMLCLARKMLRPKQVVRKLRKLYR